MVKCVRVHWLSIIEFNKLRGTRTQLRMVSTYLDTVFGCWDPRRLPFRDQSEDRISVGNSVRIIVRPVSYVEQDWTQKHGRYISCTCIACTTLSLYSLKAFTTVEVPEECSSLHLYFVLKCFCCWIYCMSGSFKVAQVWLSIGYGIYKFSTFPLNIYEKSAAVLNTECCIGWRQNVCMCYWIGWWCWLLLSRSTALAKKKKWLNELHIPYISIVLLHTDAEQLHIPYSSISFSWASAYSYPCIWCSLFSVHIYSQSEYCYWCSITFCICSHTRRNRAKPYVFVCSYCAKTSKNFLSIKINNMKRIYR